MFAELPEGEEQNAAELILAAFYKAILAGSALSLIVYLIIR